MASQTEQDLQNLTVESLKIILKSSNLPTTGTKNVLVDRILENFDNIDKSLLSGILKHPSSNMLLMKKIKKTSSDVFFTDQECDKFRNDRSKNPRTGRTINITGNVYKQLAAHCDVKEDIIGKTPTISLTEQEIKDITNQIDPELRDLIPMILNSQVTSLTIGNEMYNFVGQAGDIRLLLNLLELNITIKHLVIKNFLFDNNASEALQNVLHTNELLSLSFINCGDDDDNSLMKMISEELSHNKILESLSFSKCYIMEDELGMLCKSLHQNSTLTSLDLNASLVGVDNDNYDYRVSANYKYINKLLSKNTTITSLNLNEDVGNVEQLTTGISKTKTLKVLNISSSVLRYASKFLDALKNNTSIRALDMSDIFFDYIFGDFMNALATKPIHTLKIKNVNLSDRRGDVEALAGAFNTLEVLDISDTMSDIHDPFKFVDKIIKTNQNLHTLNISGFPTHIGSIENIVNTINNSNITSLDISGPILIDFDVHSDTLDVSADVKALIRLFDNKNLKLLNISGYEINEMNDILPDIGKALVRNWTLESLDISFSSGDQRNTKRFLEALLINQTLLNLRMELNDLSTSGELLKNILINNTTLSHIDMIGCKIDDDIGRLVVEGLQHNRSVIKFEIHKNNLSKYVESEIRSLIHRNKIERAHFTYMSKGLLTTLLQEI